MGGLGNQLFIYAASKALALKNHIPLKLDIANGYKKDAFGRSYQLDNFNLTSGLCNPFERYEISVKYILAKKFGMISKNFLFEIPDQNYHHYFSKAIYNRKIVSKTFLFGNWQSEKYFLEFENEIRSELSFKDSLLNKSTSIMGQILSSNSVALHIRQLRDLPGSNSNIPKLDNLYYDLAVKKIRSFISNPHFFIFGDDTKWFKSDPILDDSFTIVTNNNPVEDLQLMSQCKHFIISNSTFAWWGAWLSTSNKKLVVTPDKMFWDNQDIIPDNWIIIV